MTITQQRMAAVFNEWAKRYADDPDEFGEILGDDGKPVTDYGERCALYFERLASEMDAAGLLPKPDQERNRAKPKPKTEHVPQTTIAS